MQKILIFFLWIICAATACKHANPGYLDLIDNDWKNDRLKGRVKKIVETYYLSSGPYGQLATEYNERGFISRKVSKSLKPGENMVSEYVYSYDTINNVTTVSWLVNGEKTQWELYYYDQHGKLQKYVTGVKGRENAKEWFYSYDQKGRPLDERYYGDGNLIGTTGYEYLSDGSKKTTVYDGPNKKRSETIIKDTLEIEKRYDAGPPSTLIRKNAAGLLIYMEIRDENGKPAKYLLYYYNQYNDHVMTISYSAENKKYDTLIIKYTYDKFGNYTRRDGACSRELTYW
jgi:hypothetical protein